jgi:hypothetical protein
VRVAHSINRLLDTFLRRADLAVVPRSRLNQLNGARASPLPVPPLPPGADEVLRADHPTLADLERRYRGYPAADSSQWGGDFVRNAIDMRFFRANNAFVWQQWDLADPFRYGLATYFTRLQDRLSLFDRLVEDGLFGVETYDVDGTIVSRDLLDSITELTFLDDELGISQRDVTILDIGAGYGRLAHRATTAFENVSYLCADAIPLSTFLSGYYLGFRGVAERAQVVPLDRIADVVAGTRIDVAVNIHSFSECPVTAIEWWLDLLAESTVQHLLIVPNQEKRLVSKEREGPKVDLMPRIRERGFELVRQRPKYGGSDFMQKHGLHGRAPMYYFLFARR